MNRVRVTGIALLGAFVILTIAFTATRSAQAGVVDTTGNVIFVAPPPNVVLTTFEDNTNVRLFREQSGLMLPIEIAVDVTMSGLVDSSRDRTPARLAAGTHLDSYLLHADPLSHGIPIRMYAGSVTFDRPILGAMITYDSLTASDALLGSATTNYIPPEVFRGFEGPGFRVSHPSVSDSLEISADFLTLSFAFRTESRMDQIRIVTVANPEPSTLLLVSLAAVALAQMRHRSRQIVC